jgi:hypothetical protein
MPVLYHIRHSVRDHIARFFQDSAESLERHMSGCKFECDALTGALAAVILTGIETHIIRNPGYKKQVLDPLLRVMRIAGIQM